MKKKVVHFLCAAAAHTTHMTCGWTELTDCLASCRAGLAWGSFCGNGRATTTNAAAGPTERTDRRNDFQAGRQPQKKGPANLNYIKPYVPAVVLPVLQFGQNLLFFFPGIACFEFFGPQMYLFS